MSQDPQRESARIKKVTVTIQQDWEPIDPNDPVDVALAAELSKIPAVWNLNPKKMNISQNRKITPIESDGEKQAFQKIGPTTASISGELLD